MGVNDGNWWRGGIIYQIYPRSFQDTDGDGIGDLEGIRRRLGYVAGLGVDGVWLSPFFRSPMQDFGYDISDYRSVDPCFGGLADFDRIVEEAHRLGLRVMVDQVLAHTSDHHPWFEESRRDRHNARADWYVWADPGPDGTPPNNWLSVFGGSAWRWEPRRHQYYLHHFLASQPHLNYHHPAVAEAMLATVRFWLQRGIDGLRLDAINYLFHDPRLRDNPPASVAGGRAPARSPYDRQRHLYDKSRPETPALLRRLRHLADHHGQVVLMGEIHDENAARLTAEYTSGGDRLHMAYSFDLLSGSGGAQCIRDTVEALEAGIGDGYPCWSMGNHDTCRVATRWGRGVDPHRIAPLYVALLTSLRGSVCLYQGDELGLGEADIAEADRRDRGGLGVGPGGGKGRDGCRTPMPWEAGAAAAGFTTGRPWLPIPRAHRMQAVDVQQQLPGSALNRCRRFLHWRRGHPALIEGSIRFHDAPTNTLLLERRTAEERLLIAFNPGADPAHIPLPDGRRLEALDGHGFLGCVTGHRIALDGYQAFFARIVTGPSDG